MTKEQASTNSTSRIPTLILNGFLGSGKTTLLRSLIAQSHKKKLDLGVLVNEMSELDIDGQIVAQTDFFEDGNSHFQSIYSCVLSSKKGIQELERALAAMLSVSPPELLIIETSGSCHPMPLVEFFAAQSQFKLTGLLTLVDAAMIDQDYDCGRRIMPTMQRNVQSQRRDTTNLTVEQILFCNHILLTKADRIDNEKVQLIAESIHELNPLAPVMSLPWGNLPLDDIRAMPEYDYSRVQQLLTELASSFESESSEGCDYDLATRVIKDDRPFHPQRLWDLCSQHLGQQIYRSKGFFYLCSRDDVALLWNQAAAGINLELVGYWRAGILENKDNRLDEMERAVFGEQLANKPGRFGDRECHLTVIGDRTQVDQFTDSLMQCFLTEGEIARWQSGEDFSDPWPDNIVTRAH